ncbi:RES domain-containing protein [Roseomonas sp. HJA6]|uniref:RES domain-containing protein n=1 Tax=Roseomonas alba TaxID=2846776 RepID=A0ABS7AC64_9PROT|nr:RES domain-containing protein [Neoroseomonas alba]
MPLRVVRIARAAHPVWSGIGAAMVGGRWNAVGVPVIYAASSKALSMLEVLVQGGDMAAPRDAVAAIIPDTVAIEELSPLPEGWREIDSPAAMAAGTEWAVSGRTAVLRVPSAIVPEEPNYLVNPAHPAAARIAVTDPVRVEWDPRLFGIVGP